MAGEAKGHDFGRSNNAEGRLLYVAGEQTSSLSFRLDQVELFHIVANIYEARGRASTRSIQARRRGWPSPSG